MKFLIALFLSLALTGCVTTPKVEPESPIPSSALKADWDARPEAKAWTAMLAQALKDHGQALLQSHPEGSCGEPLQFWIMLASSLSRYESGHKPDAFYREAFKDRKGNWVISRGLFQMSLESSNGNYACGITDAELSVPSKAIPCFVKAANKLVGQDHVVAGGSAGAWKGLARYWSPFRDPKKSAAIFEKARSTCK